MKERERERENIHANWQSHVMTRNIQPQFYELQILLLTTTAIKQISFHMSFTFRRVLLCLFALLELMGLILTILLFMRCP